MLHTAPTELLNIFHETNYQPTYLPNKNGPKIVQIGEDQHYGYTFGPIFRVIFADIASVSATHIKVYGISNLGDDTPIFKKQYFIDNPVLDIYLKRFEFTDINGDVVVVSPTSYTIVGCKSQNMPIRY